MVNETAMIRRQMKQTRQALAIKLEMLEHRVMDRVHGVSTAMTETVDSVQDVVQQTIRTVRGSVQQTVAAVKDTLDLKRQVDRRPWTVLAGATALGFIGGYFLPGTRPGGVKVSRRGPSPALAGEGALEDHHSVASDATKGTDAAAIAAAREPSLPANRAGMFAAEISQLKGLAVGTLFAIVRDAVTQSVPKPMEREVADVIDGITVKLGGQPIRGRLLPEGSENERLEERGNQEEQVRWEHSDSHNFSPRLRRGA